MEKTLLICFMLFITPIVLTTRSFSAPPDQNGAAPADRPAKTEAPGRGSAAVSKKQIGWGQLYRAATKESQQRAAERLIARGEDVNARSESGMTPLYFAARQGNAVLVALLLSNGADIAGAGSLGTPLHAAASEGHRDVVELLLARGADVNAKGERDKTPLHLAAFEGRRDIAQLLIAHKAEVNAKDHFGDTPLHWATGGKQKEMVILLIANGADLTAKDLSGQTPLDMAMGMKDKEMVDLLKK